MSSLKELYNKIPKFTCIPGCHACCGPVPCNPEEQAALHLGTPIIPTKIDNVTCIFLTDQGCSVYANRPFMCRLFGTTQNIRCPRGAKPNKLLTPKQEKKILQKYITGSNMHDLQQELQQFLYQHH